MKAVAMKYTRPSLDKKMYTPCHVLEKACTFLCPELLANTLTGRDLASFVALGRNFGVTFRVAPRLRAAPPYRLRAEGAELRAGGGPRDSEGCAENPT